MEELGAGMTEWGKAYHREQKVEIGDVARAIREAVTVEEALSVYAPQYRPRNHRCPCPIHHGEDYNFLLHRPRVSVLCVRCVRGCHRPG